MQLQNRMSHSTEQVAGTQLTLGGTQSNPLKRAPIYQPAQEQGGLTGSNLLPKCSHQDPAFWLGEVGTVLHKHVAPRDTASALQPEQPNQGAELHTPTHGAATHRHRGDTENRGSPTNSWQVPRAQGRATSRLPTVRGEAGHSASHRPPSPAKKRHGTHRWQRQKMRRAARRGTPRPPPAPGKESGGTRTHPALTCSL